MGNVVYSKMAIGITQIGLRRFHEVVKDNHLKLFEDIKQRYETKIYDFYRDLPDPECQFKESGTIQLFDFIKAKNAISEDIIMKIRSDIFITKTAHEIIINEIEKIFNNENDICFIGLDLKNHYNDPSANSNCIKENKVVDYIVICKKHLINDNLITKIEISTGNKAFFRLISPSIRFRNISTQIYVVKKLFDKLDNWEIFESWISSSFKKNYPKIYLWVKNNPEIIRNF